MYAIMLNETRTDRYSSSDVAINSEVLLKNCMGSASFALTLLDELEASGRGYVESIARHAVASDCAAMAEAAHSLKGAAGIIGAETLQVLAAKIERAGAASELDSLVQLVDCIRLEMEKCLEQIHSIRLQSQPAANVTAS